MEILAAAQKELATNTDLDASVDLPLKIIENSNRIPMILVDDKGEIINYQNLDSTKALQPDYVNKQLEIMKNENNPVEISFKGRNKQFIYYRNSDLLNKLSYYPLALLLILGLFYPSMMPKLSSCWKHRMKSYSCGFEKKSRINLS